MDCPAYREAVSARIDGEETGLEGDALDAHLAGCPACRTWAETAIAVTRSARVGLADPVPDLAAEIVAAMTAGAAPEAVRRPAPALKASATPAHGGARRRPSGRTGSRMSPASPGKVARLGLLLVGLAQVCLAIPALLGTDAGAPVHVAHEQGAWAVALAVALLAVAWRPARAGALLPFVAALAAGLAVTMIVDIAAGRTQAAAEAPHGLAFLGLGMLWLLSRHTRPDAVDTTRPGTGTPKMAKAA
jgi:predicted anti-sigma-YlaC factor YlaD